MVLLQNSQISTNVYLLHVRTEPHVLILLEVIAVIAWLDTLEVTVKQVTTGGPQDFKANFKTFLA